jgi:phosphohistidine phosphatase
MSRRLLVLRHAKSDWNTDAASDFERPLAKRGKRDAPRMGTWMHRQGLVPAYVVSSPAKRAKQTVERLCEELALDGSRVHWDQEVYGGGIASLLGVLEACPAEADPVLLVGHNPGLEDLVTFLDAAIEPPPDGKLLPTAALAELEMPDDWSELTRGSARLIRVTRPKEIDI